MKAEHCPDAVVVAAAAVLDFDYVDFVDLFLLYQ